MGFLGEFLLRNGLVTQLQLAEALRRQAARNLTIGQLAVIRGCMTADEALALNAEQRFIDMPFGRLAVERGLISETELDEMLFEQTIRHVRLGEALLEMEALTPEDFEAALQKFREEEKQREDSAESFISADPKRKFLRALVSSVEKAFTRFLHCGTKPSPMSNGYLAGETYEMTIVYDGWTIQVCAGITPELVVGIQRNIQGSVTLPEKNEAVCDASCDALLGIVSHYLESSLPGARAGVFAALPDMPAEAEGVTRFILTSPVGSMLLAIVSRRIH